MKVLSCLKTPTISILVTFLIVVLFPFLYEAGAQAPLKKNCNLNVLWIFNPSDLNVAVKAANNIVTARVTEIAPLQDSIPNLPGVSGLEQQLPSQLIKVEILKRHKGDGGKEISFTKIGNDECYPLDDPPYSLGETVTLFLVERKDAQGVFRVIAPEGRFSLKNGRLEPVAKHGGFVENWRGHSLDELEQKIRDLRDQTQ